jgi:hypothetical protein
VFFERFWSHVCIADLDRLNRTFVPQRITLSEKRRDEEDNTHGNAVSSYSFGQGSKKVLQGDDELSSTNHIADNINACCVLM